MRVAVTEAYPKQFKPIQLELTLESAQEFDALCSLLSWHPIHSTLASHGCATEELRRKLLTIRGISTDAERDLVTDLIIGIARTLGEAQSPITQAAEIMSLRQECMTLQRKLEYGA